MTTVQAASALLTAESIVIAAVALASHRAVRASLEAEVRRRTLHVTGLVTALLMGVSFAAALGYLHVAEYPSGIIATHVGERVVFGIALFSLLGLLYLGLFLLVVVSGKLLISSVEDEA